jgi:hypothetical protein
MKRTHICFVFFLISCDLYAQTVRDEYRFNAGVVHPLTKKIVTSFAVAFALNEDKNENEYDLYFPGVTYIAAKWLQFSGGLTDVFTNNWNSENSNELRPYAAIKFLIPNTAKVHLYNATQYEYRYIKKTETKSVTEYGRIRNRFGALIPLNKKPWASNTFYAISDIEPFYRFDKDMIDQIRFRMGPGYVLNGRFRFEFIWRMELTRSAKTDPFAYTDNTFRLNLKIATKEGVFKALLHPDF